MTAVEEAVPAFAQPKIVEKVFSLPIVSDTYYYGRLGFVQLINIHDQDNHFVCYDPPPHPPRTCNSVLPVLSPAAPPGLHLHTGRQPPLVPPDLEGEEAAGGSLHRAQPGQGPGDKPSLGLLVCTSNLWFYPI